MRHSSDAQPSIQPMRAVADAPFAQFTPGAWKSHALMASNQTARSFPARYRYAKRALDLIVATVGLIICAPVIVLLALLVRLDSSGPAFFVQRRVGQHGTLFPIFKLRTMYVSGPPSAADGVDDGARVTRVGRVLRSWSLDELPQLLNVLLGDMSLVGPRPERPEIVLARYESWQYARFDVPQGLTGWWQITDRGRTRLCDDLTNDLAYLERASFWFDLKIIALTIPAVIRQAVFL